MSPSLKTTHTLMAEIEAAIAELEEAEELLRRTRGQKAYIGFAGGIYVETSKEEALEYIERRKRSLRALIERLKEELSRSKQ